MINEVTGNSISHIRIFQALLGLGMQLPGGSLNQKSVVVVVRFDPTLLQFLFLQLVLQLFLSNFLRLLIDSQTMLLHLYTPEPLQRKGIMHHFYGVEKKWVSRC